jgi:hypothetical protein
MKEGYTDTLDIKVPSFNLKARFYVREAKNLNTLAPELRVDMESFENNIRQTLDSVITRAVQTALKENGYSNVGGLANRIGSHSADFPVSFDFVLANEEVAGLNKMLGEENEKR